MPNKTKKSPAGLSRDERTRFLLALRELDDAWVSAFHKTGFGDIYFSRLFKKVTGLTPTAFSSGGPEANDGK